MLLFKNVIKLINLSFFFSLLSFSSVRSTSLEISIIQTIDHPALNATREGFLKELSVLGYKDAHVETQSAQGNTALAAQIAQRFVSTHPDLVLAIGTTAAQAALSAAKGTTIPIVFASVTDPLSAKLVSNLEKPEANITGVSNFVSVEPQFELFKKLVPELKTIGIVYNPGEANSVAMLDKMKIAAEKLNLNLVLATASKTSDVLGASQSLCGKADALFINNDNTSLSAFKSVVKAAQACGIPAFVSDVDLLEQGALAALGPNQFDLGRQTARMADRILKNPGKPFPPVEFPEGTEEHINKALKTRKLSLAP